PAHRITHRRRVATGPGTAQVYPLSLHDALPISRAAGPMRTAGGPCHSAPPARRALSERRLRARGATGPASPQEGGGSRRRSGGSDRKSTRLNSSHVKISYAVFCLKKKNGWTHRS